MQFLNAFLPIEVTDVGIKTFSNNVHPQNALSPIFVIFGGIAIILNLVLSSNNPEISEISDDDNKA